MRSGTRESERESNKRLAIPITVRQLEAIIRMSESLAKMRLQDEATDVHVEESLRLFQVSTLEAAHSGSLAGVEGFTTEDDHETLTRIETQLKRRFPVGAQISEHAIVQDFLKQVINSLISSFVEFFHLYSWKSSDCKHDLLKRPYHKDDKHL